MHTNFDIYVFIPKVTDQWIHLWHNHAEVSKYKSNNNHTCHKHVPKLTFIYSKTFNLFSFRSFEYERIWWDLFRTGVIRTEFDNQMTMIFCFLRRCFLSAITAKTFTGPWLCIWVTRRVSYEKKELLTFRKHLSSPPVFWWARVAHLYGFLCCAIMCLYVMSSLLWCPLRFPHKNDVWFVFASSCLFVCLNYLRCLCLSGCDGVRHVLCCVFLRIVCPVLPFSLDCPFLIAPSVFSNVYLKTLKWLCWVFVLFFFVLCALCCQFLSIVHF